MKMLTLQNKLNFKPIIIALFCVLLTACDNSGSSITPSTTPRNSIEPESPRLVEANLQLASELRELAFDYLNHMESDFATVLDNLENLRSRTTQFLDSPSDDNLNVVRVAWLNAQSAYALTALHRYFASMTLPESESLEIFQLQYQISHWPILAGYIDYIDSYPDTGIVHDINVELNLPALREQHGAFDISEATLGFHVIEFLIWGENRASPRMASDYEEVFQLSATQRENGWEIGQLSNNRRRQYLSIANEALIEDFSNLQTLWLNEAVLFRERLDTLSSNELISLMIDATTRMLTEELLIRSLYPMLNGDFSGSVQSPFSRSSQNTVSAQLSAVERLMLESSSSSGTTLDSLLVSISVDFEEYFYSSFDASKACLVILYSTFETPLSANAAIQSEFEVVECINLLTNMIDHLEQVKFEFANPI